MFTREPHKDKGGDSRRELPAAVRRARKELRDRGWTYRAAAAECGVCYQHLSEVLNGHRHSRRLLTLISQLPTREEVACA